MAALLLGRSLFVYGVVALLLSLALFGNGRRRTLAYLFLWVSATGVGMELVDMVRVDQGPDITEPLLAAMATGLVLIITYGLVHAVRSSCRRHEQRRIQRERRRRPHNYHFVIGNDL